MRSKRRFTAGEADCIRAVLREQPRTKATRDKLRAIGFYISSFNSPPPFTAADFDRLVASGEIAVDGVTPAMPAVRAAPASTPVLMPASASLSDAESVRTAYRPECVRHLMVGESAPAGGTFFYYANSILYRQTRDAFRNVFGEACGAGDAFLRYFRDRGFFLDDLCLVPVNGIEGPRRLDHRRAGVKPLAARMAAANPQTVIVVMKAIIPEVREAAALAGIAPAFVELPFPRPEHQAAFLAGMVAFLKTLT